MLRKRSHGLEPLQLLQLRGESRKRSSGIILRVPETVECAPRRGLVAMRKNLTAARLLIAVNFYARGDLFRVVDTLNGVRSEAGQRR